MNSQQFEKSYATFGFGRSVRQIRHALQNRQNAREHMKQLFDSMQMHEERIERRLGAKIKGQNILEIGPGQGLERARYFGINNQVTGMDLDVIAVQQNLTSYLQMMRKNGVGRMAKTLGRRLLIGRRNEAAWAELTGVTKFKNPAMIYGNIVEAAPAQNEYDIVMTWSVFEHLPDPKAALQNVIASLKPGGVFYISLHLFSSYNGHHDIRAFTGDEDMLPLWAHLRPSTKQLVSPSSYLNEWRLAQWQALFNEVTPGADEYLDEYEARERFTPLLTRELRQELASYSDQELFTINAVYVWQKPF